MKSSKKPIKWDIEKNQVLIAERGISFEAIVVAMERGHFLASYPHPKLEHQKIFEIDLDGYLIVVPYVEDDEKIFLKTAFHSRKATKKLRN